MIRSVCLAATLAGQAGCGLIDSPTGELDLELPARKVVIDTADWELTDQGKIPAVDCAETPAVCLSRVDTWCGGNDLCAAACAGATCEISVLVSLWHTFNLAQEMPELQQIGGRPLVRLTVDRVAFTVSENTLSVTSPPLTVAVAPQGVTSTHGRGAEIVGTIPAIEPGQTIAEGELELPPDGLANLASRMKDYQTPFNLVLESTLQLQAGDDVPSGRLVTAVMVSAHASTDL
ncbi:MAG TPA: hypothetical protein VEL05_03890 [Candidatus Acidoferrum sp.]|nr:hypothetical protein [Candidatus Acidoferrum sp.]